MTTSDTRSDVAFSISLPRNGKLETCQSYLIVPCPKEGFFKTGVMTEDLHEFQDKHQWTKTNVQFVRVQEAQQGDVS